MSLSIYNIKKWVKMLTGNSIEHVQQGKGKCYRTDKIAGYYNDLTAKVSNSQKLDNNGIPLFLTPKGNYIHFPIMIFQYGLGAYDNYLLSEKKNEEMKDKLIRCANWAMENQEINGSWKNFIDEFPENPYSSMAQGEGISLLLRAYMETKNSVYKESAAKAVDFMLISLENGGTAEYRNGQLFLREFTHLPVVLNGWIFSLFGLYDFLQIEKNEDIGKKYKQSINTLVQNIDAFDNGYWSMYNMGGMITSPFYHSLHIALLNVLYELTGIEILKKYAVKWEEYRCSRIKRCISFWVKVMQKIKEKG